MKSVSENQQTDPIAQHSISNPSKFQFQIVGCLDNYLSVQVQEWQLAAQAVGGGMLNQYLVDSKKDNQTIFDYCKNLKPAKRISTIIFPFQQKKLVYQR